MYAAVSSAWVSEHRAEIDAIWDDFAKQPGAQAFLARKQVKIEMLTEIYRGSPELTPAEREALPIGASHPMK